MKDGSADCFRADLEKQTSWSPQDEDQMSRLERTVKDGSYGVIIFGLRIHAFVPTNRVGSCTNIGGC